MASKTFVRSLRAASKQKLSSQPLQKRTFTSALAIRPVVAANTRAPQIAPAQQQTRGVKTIDFAGHKEAVYGKRVSYTLSRLLTLYRARGLAERKAAGKIRS